MASLLSVQGLTKRFGGLVANDSVSFECAGGEILGVIGPNGAGKTTLLNCINGILKPDAGLVRLEGHEITGWPMHRVCRRGVARTFQIVQVVDSMRVLDNVMVGAFLHTAVASAAMAEAEKAIRFVGIESLTTAPVSSLTLAQKRKVEFARALATRPRLLLLDELLAGLTMSEVNDMVERIKRVRDQGVGLLWIEHVMEAIMPVADRIFVLCFGQELAVGKPTEIACNPRCIEAYLGAESHVAR